jgi:transposase
MLLPEGMRTTGSPFELERRRVLAVTRSLEGFGNDEIADFLGVDPRSVRRWLADYNKCGIGGLAAHASPGRPPKLTHWQEKIVRRWLSESPLEHGFSTELWSAPRLALLIQEQWNVKFAPNYLSAWLRHRGFTPQTPRRRAREQDERAVARWLERDWPRIKKTPAAGTPASC